MNNMFSLKSKPPTKTLFQHIKQRDWDRARLRTLMYPWDAHYRSPSGNNLTPMHMVCFYRAPIDVVNLILEANPAALLAQDSEGWTPIHLILLYGGDEDIALLLIRRGGTPAASVQSPFAGSPLHLACRHGSSIRIMEELIKANPYVATAENEHGIKPAEILLHQFLKNPKYQRLFQQEAEIMGEKNNQSAMIELLQKLALLIQAAKGEKMLVDKIHLHDMIRHQSQLGDLTPFLKIAVQVFPDQIERMERKGNSLLHITASIPVVPRSKILLRRPFDMHSDSIEILTRSFPAAASIVNDTGELPLHLALTKGRRTWRTGISILVEANSDALQVRDQRLNLYPFQLASAFPFGDDTESIETIFNLLTACPHALKCC